MQNSKDTTMLLGMHILTSAELIIEAVVKEFKLHVHRWLIHSSNKNPVLTEDGYITGRYGKTSSVMHTSVSQSLCGKWHKNHPMALLSIALQCRCLFIKSDVNPYICKTLGQDLPLLW